MVSQGDLTEEADTNNLYVNPLEAAEKCGNRVKKSVSGEVARNASDASPSVESLKDVRPANEGGKAPLNDTVPKHRKIRIQQVSRRSCIRRLTFGGRLSHSAGDDRWFLTGFAGAVA